MEMMQELVTVVAGVDNSNLQLPAWQLFSYHHKLSKLSAYACLYLFIQYLNLLILII